MASRFPPFFGSTSPKKRRTKKEVEEQRNKDAKGGEFLRNWCSEPDQETKNKMGVEGSKVRGIKEKLGLGDVHGKNEKEERGGGRVSELAKIFEKEIPKTKKITSLKVKMEDDSWIRSDGELGCNNSPKRMKLGTEPGVTTGKCKKDNRRHPKDNHSRDWDGGGRRLDLVPKV